jgi:PAS domain S-box-containing protein
LELVNTHCAALGDGSKPSNVSRNRNYTKDGSVIYCEWYNSALLDESGKLVSVLSLVQDVSDRKRVEQALAESYSILHAVIEGTTDSIFMKDLQGRYVTINSAGAKVIGKPLEDIIGKDDSELFPSNIALPLMENDRKLLGAERSQTYEDIVPVRGELRTFLSTKTICRNEQGKAIGLIGIARDITERKRTEKQIKKLNQDLERRVFERTAQLEATNKELESFSYSVSHDLRAPLRSIDGFSQALIERYTEQLDDKGKHYLKRVRAATQRMGELIDDLLNLSRVTRSQMQRQRVYLSALVQEITSDLQQTQPERSAEFVIAPGVLVEGDPQLLKVVLENLLSNAWKFTSNQISTRIEFGIRSQQNVKQAYFVKDNGAGFDMEYADKLFGAFQRLHTTDEFPGTGIGLATVQRIIRRHGGYVWAEGAVGQGATFYFTL